MKLNFYQNLLILSEDHSILRPWKEIAIQCIKFVLVFLISVKLCQPSSDSKSQNGEASDELLPKGEKFSHFVNDLLPQGENQCLRTRPDTSGGSSNGGNNNSSSNSCGPDNQGKSEGGDQKDIRDNSTETPRTSTADSSSSSETWKPLVLIIPLRLGLTDINPIYFDSLRVCHNVL